MKRREIDVNYLRATADYDPATGVFTSDQWIIYGPSGDGYRIMRDPASGVSLLQHRAAYAYMTGFWPRMVDHINRQKGDNRWRNLRAATARSNARNQSTSANRLHRLAQGRGRKNTDPPTLDAVTLALPAPTLNGRRLSYENGNFGIRTEFGFVPIDTERMADIAQHLLRLWVSGHLALQEAAQEEA